jgi:hypothetical protein
MAAKKKTPSGKVDTRKLKLKKATIRDLELKSIDRGNARQVKGGNVGYGWDLVANKTR